MFQCRLYCFLPKKKDVSFFYDLPSCNHYESGWRAPFISERYTFWILVGQTCESFWISTQKIHPDWMRVSKKYVHVMVKRLWCICRSPNDSPLMDTPEVHLRSLEAKLMQFGSLKVDAVCGVPTSRYGCFLKWWYPQNTPKWSFLVGKPRGGWVPPF